MKKKIMMMVVLVLVRVVLMKAAVDDVGVVGFGGDVVVAVKVKVGG